MIRSFLDQHSVARIAVGSALLWMAVPLFRLANWIGQVALDLLRTGKELGR